ncbi:MAG: hypothetical protein ABI813_09780 [Bacteroidota bacterium]
MLIAVLLAGASLFSSCGPSHMVVSRPGDIIYTRPASPGEGYIWMDGDWIWTGGRYSWREGRWARPRLGRVWYRGNWQHTAHGYRWNRGHWR